MGEYARFKGQRIKIGTCEDMYYLRARQRDQVSAERGNVRPGNPEDQKVIRFRFPWPDEDGVEPGAFDPYDRAVAVPDGGVLKVPEGVEHYSVQFSARQGYLLSIPCPEGPRAEHGRTIHRNGFSGWVLIEQQAYRNGHLALICRCGGCGAKYNLPTWEDAEPVVVACRAEADRKERPFHPAWWHAVADRIAEGYGVTGEA